MTGHAAAAGCAFALAHNAAIMRASRGFLYMSEVDAGIKIVDYFASRRWDEEVVWSWQRSGRPRGPRCGIRSRIMASVLQRQRGEEVGLRARRTWLIDAMREGWCVPAP
jgi:hypothetical protein